MPKKQFYEYAGRQVRVRYEPGRCLHAEECIKGLPGVFDRYRRPWIDPEQGSAEEITEVVMRCPTGALRIEHQDDQPVELGPKGNSAQLVADGPVYVKGRLRIEMPDGSTLNENRVALCRCGESGNKPFCDNSHRGADFVDEGRLGIAMMAAGQSGGDGDRLRIRTARNGPLLFQGPLEVQSADSADSQRGIKGALCRCGASGNRPYCDGSHAEVGFEAD